MGIINSVKQRVFLDGMFERNLKKVQWWKKFPRWIRGLTIYIQPVASVLFIDIDTASSLSRDVIRIIATTENSVKFIDNHEKLHSIIGKIKHNYTAHMKYYIASCGINLGWSLYKTAALSLLLISSVKRFVWLCPVTSEDLWRKNARSLTCQFCRSRWQREACLHF